MKFLVATAMAALAFLIIVVSPTHALTVTAATIAFGAVRVSGNHAERNTNITWEGDVVTQSNGGGLFQFSTTNLPIDCVGQLSDGVTTVSVPVFGCATQQVVISGVLRTGQTRCDDGLSHGTLVSCPAGPAGQDGELQKGIARSYTDNGDGTITDNATGLMWEKLTDAGDIHDWDTT